MATIDSLVSRVRMELGDAGKTFVERFVADGSSNRFRIHYAPLDAHEIIVQVDGIDVSNDCAVEESTGILIFDTVPTDGQEIAVSGKYYRYFTTTELEGIVNDALLQHTARSVDSVGRKLTLATLPLVEEQPVAVYAVTLALYILATDSAFDIDIQAPDGVTIPRAERYRQLMQMYHERKQQYQELCTLLGIGMYKIDVFDLRRISKGTNRYIPLFRPQEVDDRSFPNRVQIPLPTYGDQDPEWPTTAGEITAYQGREFTHTFTIPGNYTGVDLVAHLLQQRGSVFAIKDFTVVTRTDTVDNTVLEVSISANDMLRIAERTYWSIAVVNDDNTWTELQGDNFFTVRLGTVVL